MSNLTLSVDDELIKRARIRAIRQGTSLSAKVREFLQQYADESDDDSQRRRDAAAARLVQAIEAAAAQAQALQPTQRRRRSLREELYEGDFRARARAATRGG